MIYTVTWKPSASDDLLESWLSASSADRAAITAATNTIDSLLRVSPNSIGESRTESVRMVFLDPLSVTYEVRPQDRIVVVLAVHVPPMSTSLES